MGSLRTGVLGEAMINLANYINMEAPDTISLPLNKCTAGTVLHVKIQCVTPQNGPIELLVKERNSRLNEDDKSLMSESDKDSYTSGEMAEGSMRSLVPRFPNRESYLSKSQRQFKAKRGSVSAYTDQTDGPVSTPTSRQASFDYSSSGSISNRGVRKDALEEDYPTLNAFLPRKPSSIASQESRNSPESFMSSFASNFNNDGASSIKGWQDMYTWQAECTSPISLLSPSSQKGSRVMSTLSNKLDAAEATIRELKDEVLTWERQAHKLDVEGETLRQQLAFESKCGTELRIRISSLELENNCLKSELKQLKDLEAVPTKLEDLYEYTKAELDKTTMMVRTLKEEVTYERELNASLHLQLEKTQDSNNGLVSLVTELEAGMELRNKEIHELVQKRQEVSYERELNASLHLQLEKTQDSNKDLVSLVAELEAGMELRNKEIDELVRKRQELEDQLDNVQFPNADVSVGLKEESSEEIKDELSDILELLSKEIEQGHDHNFDHNELIDANIELFGKLHMANRQLDTNVKLLEVLKASVERLSKGESLVKPRNASNEGQDYVDDLRMQVKQQKDQDLINELRMLVRKLGHQNNFLEVQLIEAKSEIVSLVTEMQAVVDQNGQSQAQINELESQVPALLEEIKLLRTSDSEHRSLKLQLEMEKAEMQEKLSKTQDEVRAARASVHEVVGQMAALTAKLDAQLMEESKLQGNVLQLQIDKETLQNQAACFAEANMQLSKRITEVEAEFSRVLEETEALKIDRKMVHDHLQEDDSVKSGASEQRSGGVDLQQTKSHENKDTTLIQCISDELHLKEISSDSELVGHLRQQLQQARVECSLLNEKCCFLEAEVEKTREGDWQVQPCQARTPLPSGENLDDTMQQAEEVELGLQSRCEMAAPLSQDVFQGFTERNTSIFSGQESGAEDVNEDTNLYTGQVELQNCIQHLKLQLKEAQDKLHILLENRKEYEGEGQETCKNFSQDLSQGEPLANLRSLQSLISWSNERAFGFGSSELIDLQLETGNMRSTVDQVCQVNCMANLWLQAAIEECSNLQQEKSNAVERLAQMIQEVGELEKQNSVLVEKISVLLPLAEALETGEMQDRELGDDLPRLKSHVSGIKQRLMEQEDENLELRKRVESLEEKLQDRLEALSSTDKQLKAFKTSSNVRSLGRIDSRRCPSFSPQVFKEEGKGAATEKAKAKAEAKAKATDAAVDAAAAGAAAAEEALQLSSTISSNNNADIDDLHIVADDINELNREADEQREPADQLHVLCDRIDSLQELDNGQPVAVSAAHAADAQLTKELLRLQKRNSMLAQKEQELISSLRVQEFLQEEVSKLQDDKEFLETRLSKIMEASKNPFLLEKIADLEMDLAEASEANNLYKTQLKEVLDKCGEDLIEMDRISVELAKYKKRAHELEEELMDTNERYGDLSLKLAEAEMEKGKLHITIKNLRNGKTT